MASTVTTSTLSASSTVPQSTSTPYLAQSYSNFKSHGPNNCFVEESSRNRTKWESQCYLVVPPNGIQDPATKWLEYCCTAKPGNIFEKVDGCGWQCITNTTTGVDNWWSHCVWDDRSPLLSGYNLNLTGYEKPICVDRGALEAQKNSAAGMGEGLLNRLIPVLLLVQLVPLIFL